MARPDARRALLSVSDKTGIVELAGALRQLGFELISTGGTARAIAAAGLPVTAVEELTGFPEIMDGRVKTLHPKVHGALLGRTAIDDAVMREHGIAPIDVVVINLYPFAETIAKPGCSDEDAIENIDVGGPAMLRAAAKNHERVTVLVDPADYAAVLAELRTGAVAEATRRRLAARAFGHTARYDGIVSGWLRRRQGDSTFPDAFAAAFSKKQDLRYGENPHQSAAFYADPLAAGASIATARQLQGKELSYNNIADADTAIECVRQFDSPACVIVKHANPCGACGRDRCARGLPSRLGAGHDIRIRRNHRFQPATRCTNGRCHRRTPVRRGHRGTVLRAWRPRGARREAEHPRAGNRADRRAASPAGFELKSVAGGLLVQSRDDGIVDSRDAEAGHAPRAG